MDARERRALWLMAMPFLVGVCVLVLIPAIGSFAMAAYDWDLVRPPRFVGLDNFRELVDDPVFRISLRNSLQYAGAAVPLRLLLAVALALLLYGRSRANAAGRVGVLVPTIMPDVAYALVWLWILDPVYGPLNVALGALGLPTPAWLSQPTPTRWAVVLMGSFQLGEAFLIVVAVRRLVPHELDEIAAMSGAGRFARFVRVTLPIMAPALLLIAMRDTIVTLQSTFLPALLVTKGGPPPYATTYLPLFAYRNGFEYLRYGYASATTVVMLVLTASILWLLYRAFGRWSRRDPTSARLFASGR
jgi:multiple sugar transport system permease protein